jgi:hypothetical protein
VLLKAPLKPSIIVMQGIGCNGAQNDEPDELVWGIQQIYLRKN